MALPFARPSYSLPWFFWTYHPRIGQSFLRLFVYVLRGNCGGLYFATRLLVQHRVREVTKSTEKWPRWGQSCGGIQGTIGIERVGVVQPNRNNFPFIFLLSHFQIVRGHSGHHSRIHVLLSVHCLHNSWVLHGLRDPRNEEGIAGCFGSPLVSRLYPELFGSVEFRWDVLWGIRRDDPGPWRGVWIFKGDLFLLGGECELGLVLLRLVRNDAESEKDYDNRDEFASDNTYNFDWTLLCL